MSWHAKACQQHLIWKFFYCMYVVWEEEEKQEHCTFYCLLISCCFTFINRVKRRTMDWVGFFYTLHWDEMSYNELSALDLVWSVYLHKINFTRWWSSIFSAWKDTDSSFSTGMVSIVDIIVYTCIPKQTIQFYFCNFLLYEISHQYDAFIGLWVFKNIFVSFNNDLWF